MAILSESDHCCWWIQRPWSKIWLQQKFWKSDQPNGSLGLQCQLVSKCLVKFLILPDKVHLRQRLSCLNKTFVFCRNLFRHPGWGCQWWCCSGSWKKLPRHLATASCTSQVDRIWETVTTWAVHCSCCNACVGFFCELFYCCKIIHLRLNDYVSLIGSWQKQLKHGLYAKTETFNNIKHFYLHIVECWKKLS